MTRAKIRISRKLREIMRFLTNVFERELLAAFYVLNDDLSINIFQKLQKTPFVSLFKVLIRCV